MPDGATHRKWHHRGLVPVCSAGAFLVITHPESAGYIAIGLGGYILGSIIEPDLDQIGITSSEGRLIRVLGLPGVFWAAYWLPYAWIMPHRSFFSHFPGVSTAIRLAYVLAFPTWALWRYNLLQPWMATYLFFIWAGLSISDFIHWFLDVTH